MEIVSRTTEYAVAQIFVVCFVLGGFTGLLLANAGIDMAYHDTYFVIGHFHYVLSIAAALGFLLFLLRISTSVFSGVEVTLSVLVVIYGITVGVNTLFLLLHLIGIEGHPRRVFLSAEIYSGVSNLANAGFCLLFVLLPNIFPTFVQGRANQVKLRYRRHL